MFTVDVKTTAQQQQSLIEDSEENTSNTRQILHFLAPRLSSVYDIGGNIFAVFDLTANFQISEKASSRVVSHVNSALVSFHCCEMSHVIHMPPLTSKHYYKETTDTPLDIDKS